MNPPTLTDLPAVILAAGLSRRAAPHNKLLRLSAGEPVVRRTVRAFCSAGLGEVVVATGHDRENVEAALAGLPVRFVFAADFASGMGHSLSAAIRTLRLDLPGIAIAPGDLPELTPALVTRIAAQFLRNKGTRHVIPTAGGQRGHPVLVGAWLRAPLETLTGDEGARRLLAMPAELARCDFLEVGEAAIHRDVDGLA